MKNLPAIFNELKKLERIETVEEAKEFANRAEALRVYAKKAGLNLEAQNYCAEGKIRAERKAGELLRENPNIHSGQPRKESLHDERILLNDMAISEIQSHRWQKEAEISEETLERYLASCKEKETEVTTVGFLKAAGIHTKLMSEGGEEYWTPEHYIRAVYGVLGEIELDPASCEEANQTVKAKKFYSKQDDGLSQPWYGKVFMNPPYGIVGPDFVTKFIDEFNNGNIEEGIILVNSGSTDTAWFQVLFDGVMCFTDHRILFDSPTKDRPPPAPIHGSCFVYFGNKEKLFAKTFKKFGNVVKRFY